MPPRYKNGEYWLVRQISTAITMRPAAPAPSSSSRLARPGCAGIRRLGWANASAAPMSSANARVSVPS
jgi:hypothetical protein